MLHLPGVLDLADVKLHQQTNVGEQKQAKLGFDGQFCHDIALGVN